MRLDQTSIGKISAFIAEHVTRSPVITNDSADVVRVNDMTIRPELGSWAVSTRKESLASFPYKSWALAYAVARANNNKHVQDYLSTNGTRLSKLQIDKDLYNYHLRQALRRGDDTKACIIEGRLSRTEQEIFELLDEAQQVLLYQRIG